jgi:hypothetical protein
MFACIVATTFCFAAVPPPFTSIFALPMVLASPFALTLVLVSRFALAPAHYEHLTARTVKHHNSWAGLQSHYLQAIDSYEVMGVANTNGLPGQRGLMRYTTAIHHNIRWSHTY